MIVIGEREFGRPIKIDNKVRTFHIVKEKIVDMDSLDQMEEIVVKSVLEKYFNGDVGKSNHDKHYRGAFFRSEDEKYAAQIAVRQDYAELSVYNEDDRYTPYFGKTVRYCRIRKEFWGRNIQLMKDGINAILSIEGIEPIVWSE